MENDRERLKKALDSMIFLPHLKDRQSQNALTSLFPDSKASGGVGRPWDKGDLFRRLQTFRASTWFAKPDAISATECARHGWENTSVDMITCESCKATISCPVPPQLMPSEAQQAGEKFSKKLTEAHEVACPWRSTSCSLSLLNFPELPRSAVSLDFKERSSTIERLICLPPLAEDPVNAILSSPLGSQIVKLLSAGPTGTSTATDDALDNTINTDNNNRLTGQQNPSFQGDAVQQRKDLVSKLTNKVAITGDDVFLQRERLLTLCGWTVQTLNSTNNTTSVVSDGSNKNNAQNKQYLKPESCSFSCGMCGAKAGLWNNFPECQPEAVSQAITAVNNKTSLLTTATTTRQPQSTAAGQSPGGGSLPTRYVAFDLSGTIAGGSIETTTTTAAGANSFTQTSTILEDDNVPVFGFAALRAKEPGATSPPASKRPRISAPAPAAAGGGGINTNNNNGITPGKTGAAATGAVEGSNAGSSSVTIINNKPSAALLQKYRSMATVPLDPIGTHRPYCPWIRTAGNISNSTAGESGAVLCGWQWCVQQLVPDGSGRKKSSTLVAAGRGTQEEEEEEEGRDPSWNPSQLLRNALSKVEVKK